MNFCNSIIASLLVIIMLLPNNDSSATQEIAIRSGEGCKFSGNIETNTDSAVLELVYYSDLIEDGKNERKYITTKVGKSGVFQLKIPNIKKPTYFQLNEKLSNITVDGWDLKIMEPGDDITLEIKKIDDEFITRYSGNGYEKYECLQRIRKITDDQIYNSDISISLRIADSLMNQSVRSLQFYGNKISPQIGNLYITDIKSRIGKKLISKFYSLLSDNLSINIVDSLKKDYKYLTNSVFWRSLDPANCDPASVEYTSLIYLYCKINLGFDFPNNTFSFSDLFDYIKLNYSDLLRDKLLASLILGDDASILFNGTDPTIFEKCMNGALGLINSRGIYNWIIDYKKSRGKGSKAYNFSLLADSSGQTTKLSDFKGKTVLIDMWGHTCTGCLRFSKAFHQYIYPKFRENPDFKVVSIMLDEGASYDSYLERLRNTNKYPYTSREYINLFGGKDAVDAKYMANHYSIKSVPMILLVDKTGNIKSSTLPIFSRIDSSSINMFVKLISETLNE